MTKDELVRQAAKCFSPKVTTVKEEKAFIEGFVRGAEWMQEKMQETNEGQALLYAVEKTADRTKREMIEKAVEWLSNNMFNSINNGVIINGYCVSDFIGRFKRAMQDESRRLD